MKKSILLAASLVLLVGCGGGGVAKSYTAGTYSATADGFGGPVPVEVEFAEDKIVAVNVGENSETPDIGGAAIADLTAKIVEAGTYEVDDVAGATVTSTAVKTAVKDAIDQASK